MATGDRRSGTRVDVPRRAKRQLVQSTHTTLGSQPYREHEVRNPMRMRCHTVILGTIVAFALLGVRFAGQVTDPLIGTWELNVAKSKFSPGPAPKSETRTYVAAGPDIKASSKSIDADGKPTDRQWTVNYDGKEHPEIGNPDADRLTLKRIDAFTAEFTEKKADKVVITGGRVISKDGKVMTITAKGTNAKGQMISNVMVFDKR
jgi:hypothetical protein